MSEPVRVVNVSPAPQTRPVRVPAPADAEVVIPLRIALGQLADVDTTDPAPPPADVPLVWRLHPDGIYRMSPLEVETSWGDEVRFGTGQPADAAPVGAVHVDVAGGRVYRNTSPEGNTP